MLTNRQSLLALVLGMLLLLFASSVPAAEVDINSADAATLARELKGIGLKRAQDIVAYRQKHGPFRSPDELALVKGIGVATISKNRDVIRIGGSKPPAQRPAPAGRSASSPSTRSGGPATR